MQVEFQGIALYKLVEQRGSPSDVTKCASDLKSAVHVLLGVAFGAAYVRCMKVPSCCRQCSSRWCCGLACACQVPHPRTRLDTGVGTNAGLAIGKAVESSSTDIVCALQRLAESMAREASCRY
jgi:hypothetical protein